MAHGYARDYDDFDRGEDRERASRDRDWRDRDYRDRERSSDRRFMFSDDERDRGWSSDDERDYRPGRGAWENDRDWRQRNEDIRSGYQGRSSFSSHPDEHYRSWRQRQIESLDRDYADYCREREQQFHSDFDAWRSQRRANPERLQTGMTQTGPSADPTGITQAENETAPAMSEAQSDPMGTATLGTSSRGRNRP